MKGIFGRGFLIQGSGEPLGNLMGARMVLLSWKGTQSPRRKEPCYLLGPESAPPHARGRVRGGEGRGGGGRVSQEAQALRREALRILMLRD